MLFASIFFSSTANSLWSQTDVSEFGKAKMSLVKAVSLKDLVIRDKIQNNTEDSITVSTH